MNPDDLWRYFEMVSDAPDTIAFFWLVNNPWGQMVGRLGQIMFVAFTLLYAVRHLFYLLTVDIKNFLAGILLIGLLIIMLWPVTLKIDEIPDNQGSIYFPDSAGKGHYASITAGIPPQDIKISRGVWWIWFLLTKTYNLAMTGVESTSEFMAETEVSPYMYVAMSDAYLQPLITIGYADIYADYINTCQPYAEEYPTLNARSPNPGPTEVPPEDWRAVGFFGGGLGVPRGRYDEMISTIASNAGLLFPIKNLFTSIGSSGGRQLVGSADNAIAALEANTAAEAVHLADSPPGYKVKTKEYLAWQMGFTPNEPANGNVTPSDARLGELAFPDSMKKLNADGSEEPDGGGLNTRFYPENCFEFYQLADFAMGSYFEVLDQYTSTARTSGNLAGDKGTAAALMMRGFDQIYADLQNRKGGALGDALPAGTYVSNPNAIEGLVDKGAHYITNTFTSSVFELWVEVKSFILQWGIPFHVNTLIWGITFLLIFSPLVLALAPFKGWDTVIGVFYLFGALYLALFISAASFEMGGYIVRDLMYAEVLDRNFPYLNAKPLMAGGDFMVLLITLITGLDLAVAWFVLTGESGAFRRLRTQAFTGGTAFSIAAKVVGTTIAATRVMGITRAAAPRAAPNNVYNSTHIGSMFVSGGGGTPRAEPPRVINPPSSNNPSSGGNTGSPPRRGRDNPF